MAGSTASFLAIARHLIDRNSKKEEEEERAEHLEEIKTLLNTQNREGNTVLHEAALNDDEFLVKKIISLRLVDEQIENKEGLTALQITNDLNAQKFKEDFEKKRIKEERALERRRK